jgi:hypothetical protein
LTQADTVNHAVSPSQAIAQPALLLVCARRVLSVLIFRLTDNVFNVRWTPLSQPTVSSVLQFLPFSALSAPHNTLSILLDFVYPVHPKWTVVSSALQLTTVLLALTLIIRMIL